MIQILKAGTRIRIPQHGISCNFIEATINKVCIGLNDHVTYECCYWDVNTFKYIDLVREQFELSDRDIKTDSIEFKGINSKLEQPDESFREYHKKLWEAAYPKTLPDSDTILSQLDALKLTAENMVSISDNIKEAFSKGKPIITSKPTSNGISYFKELWEESFKRYVNESLPNEQLQTLLNINGKREIDKVIKGDTETFSEHYGISSEAQTNCPNWDKCSCEEIGRECYGKGNNYAMVRVIAKDSTDPMIATKRDANGIRLSSQSVLENPEGWYYYDGNGVLVFHLPPRIINNFVLTSASIGPGGIGISGNIKSEDEEERIGIEEPGDKEIEVDMRGDTIYVRDKTPIQHIDISFKIEEPELTQKQCETHEISNGDVCCNPEAMHECKDCPELNKTKKKKVKKYKRSKDEEGLTGKARNHIRTGDKNLRNYDYLGDDEPSQEFIKEIGPTAIAEGHVGNMGKCLNCDGESREVNQGELTCPDATCKFNNESIKVASQELAPLGSLSPNKAMHNKLKDNTCPGCGGDLKIAGLGSICNNPACSRYTTNPLT